MKTLEHSCRLSESVDDDVSFCMVCKRKDTIIYVEFYTAGDVGVIAENSKEKKMIYNADISMTQVLSTLNTIFNIQEIPNEQ